MAEASATSEELLRQLSRLWGALRTVVVACDADQVIERLADSFPVPEGGPSWSVCSPLEGCPLVCADIRSAGRQARAAGVPLLVRDTLCGPWGCAAPRLGAHVAVYELAQCSLVGIARDAARVLPDIDAWLASLPSVADARVPQVVHLVEAARSTWHLRCDAAQVIVSYLRCHPRIVEVRYPGLKGDPSFELAARTLTGGFGPLVDYRCVGEDAWRRLSGGEEDVHEQIMSLEAQLGPTMP